MVNPMLSRAANSCPLADLQNVSRHQLNNTTQIMRQDLTQRLIYLRRLALAAESFTKLSLNHREGCLNITTPMISLHKSLLIHHVEVIHTLPQFTALLVRAGGVGAKSDVRHRLFRDNELQVSCAAISLISNDTLHNEVARRRVDERRELRAISPACAPSLQRSRRSDQRFRLSLNGRLGIAPQ